MDLPQYEYRQDNLRINGGSPLQADITPHLNARGADGWELMSSTLIVMPPMVHGGAAASTWFLFWGRPKIEVEVKEKESRVLMEG